MRIDEPKQECIEALRLSRPGIEQAVEELDKLLAAVPSA